MISATFSNWSIEFPVSHIVATLREALGELFGFERLELDGQIGWRVGPVTLWLGAQE